MCVLASGSTDATNEAPVSVIKTMHYGQASSRGCALQKQLSNLSPGKILLLFLSAYQVHHLFCLQREVCPMSQCSAADLDTGGIRGVENWV